MNKRNNILFLSITSNFCFFHSNDVFIYQWQNYCQKTLLCEMHHLPASSQGWESEFKTTSKHQNCSLYFMQQTQQFNTPPLKRESDQTQKVSFVSVGAQGGQLQI